VLIFSGLLSRVFANRSFSLGARHPVFHSHWVPGSSTRVRNDEALHRHSGAVTRFESTTGMSQASLPEYQTQLPSKSPVPTTTMRQAQDQAMVLRGAVWAVVVVLLSMLCCVVCGVVWCAVWFVMVPSNTVILITQQINCFNLRRIYFVINPTILCSSCSWHAAWAT
jgi:hypothetical protein